MSTPTLNQQQKPSNPQLWKSISQKYKQASRGGEAGKWTPRKLALALRRYEKEGGKWEDDKRGDNGISK